jgi:hypothetical protein
LTALDGPLRTRTSVAFTLNGAILLRESDPDMAKYLIIIGLTIIDDDDGSKSSEKTEEYVVTCDPSELEKMISEKKQSFQRSGDSVCPSGYSASTRVVQVLSL